MNYQKALAIVMVTAFALASILVGARVGEDAMGLLTLTNPFIIPSLLAAFFPLVLRLDIIPGNSHLGIFAMCFIGLISPAAGQFIANPEQGYATTGYLLVVASVLLVMLLSVYIRSAGIFTQALPQPEGHPA